MALIIGGKAVEVPGLATHNWNDVPALRLRMTNDMCRRVGSVRGIVLHTTKGIPGGTDLRPQVLEPGFGKPVNAGERCARYWSTSDDQAGAHLVVDFDGAVSCCADLQLEAAYHAGPVNQFTIGIEIYQGSRAELYEGQLETVVVLCDALTRIFGIQRQIPDKHRGALARFSMAGASGKDYYGVYGHREVSSMRGRGDPGDFVFRTFARGGYEDFDVSTYADQTAWKARQKKLGLPADGVPGPKTVAALQASGYPHGLWVRRPGDTGGGTGGLVS